MKCVDVFFHNLKKLWAWLPIIWHDQDWDSFYLEKIIHFKLGRMAKFFASEHAYTANAKEVAKQIEEVHRLLGHLLEDNYLEEICPDYFEKFHKEPMRTERIQENGQTFYRLIDLHTEEEHREMHHLHMKSSAMMEQERALVYTLLKEQIFGWSD